MMKLQSETLSRIVKRWKRSVQKRIRLVESWLGIPETAIAEPKKKPQVANKTGIQANVAVPWRPVSQEALPQRSVLAPPPKVLAWYLPQFHPVPENDAWWGVGFTEWRNVVRATPIYPGHDQPRLPADLGFYDLRLPETQQRQADLAREYGFHGFVYHYYWFNGRRLLERPLEQMLRSGEPDFPFCINWANENWTRRWDGRDQEILLHQEHSLAADVQFIRDVIPILKDRRYITCDGKPMLIVYRPDLIQHPPETTAAWREEAVNSGLKGLHLCAVQFKTLDPIPLGFDALIEFPPHHFPAPKFDPKSMGASADFKGVIYDFCGGVRKSVIPEARDFPFYRGAMPGWDNTARRLKHATIYHGATPEIFQYWLHQIMVESRHIAAHDDHFVFVNAWNEWAEGAYLEPDQSNGSRWLEATRDAIAAATLDGHTCPAPPAVTPTLPALRLHSSAPGPISWGFPAQGNWGDGKRRPVLCVSHDAALAGAQVLLLRIVEHLANHDQLEPWVLLRRGGVLEADFRRVAPVLRVNEAGGGQLAFGNAIEQIVKSFRERQPAFALCNTVVSSDVAEICDRYGIPVLTQVFELPTSIDGGLGRETIERVRRYSRRVIAASEFVKSALGRAYNFPENLLEVIHYGIPSSSLELADRVESRRSVLQEFGWDDDTFLVLGCGSIHPRKGPDLFVQTAIALGERVTQGRLRFLWLGANQDSTLPRTWCDHDLGVAGLQGLVQFGGERPNLDPYFAAADAFALTSREDPFPTVNLMAMAAGLPVVAFAGAGGAPEAFGSDAGVTVPYLNVAAMAEVLARFAGNPDEARSLGLRARTRIAERFTAEHFFPRFLELAERDFGPFTDLKNETGTIRES